jgi:hypothetical protein
MTGRSGQVFGRTIKCNGLIGRCPSALPGLRRLDRGGDELRHKIRIRPARGVSIDGRLSGFLPDRCNRNQSVLHGPPPVPNRDIHERFPVSRKQCAGTLKRPTAARFSEFFRLLRYLGREKPSVFRIRGRRTVAISRREPM